MSNPRQITSALRGIFPSATFGKDVVVRYLKGVTKVIKTPRPLGDGELEAAIAALPPPAPPVPASVTPLQMRRALRATGLKATVDSALAAQSEEVREEWEFASEVRRDNATLNALGQSLGKSPADLDTLFRLAATL